MPGTPKPLAARLKSRIRCATPAKPRLLSRGCYSPALQEPGDHAAAPSLIPLSPATGRCRALQLPAFQELAMLTALHLDYRPAV